MRFRGPRSRAILLCSYALLVVAEGMAGAADAADLIFPATGSTTPHFMQWQLASAPSGAGHTDYFEVEARSLFLPTGWVSVGTMLSVADLCQTTTTRSGPKTWCWFAMPDRTAEYRVRGCNFAAGCGGWTAEPREELIACCTAALPPPPFTTCYAGLAALPAICQ